VIELSKDLRLAPLCAKYPGLTRHFQEVSFDPKFNLWNAVFDFTGRSDGANWEIQRLENCEELVVSFQGCLDEADGPSQVTQELLTADPLTSGENHGESVANIPQTRPAKPPKSQAERPRRRFLDDRPTKDGGDRRGKLEEVRLPADTKTQRDFWGCVAEEINEGTLAEDFNLDRAQTMETPASRPGEGLSKAEAEKLLATVPEKGERDLWSHVAEEIQDRTLAQDFSLIRAEVLETPVAGPAENEAKKLLANVKVEVLDDDSDDVNPKRQAAKPHGWSIGDASRVSSWSASQKAARAATAAAVSGSIAPLVRGQPSSSLAGKGPLGGLRLSAPSGKAQAKPKAATSGLDSSDEDISVGESSAGGTPKAYYSSAVARSLFAKARDSSDDEESEPARRKPKSSPSRLWGAVAKDVEQHTVSQALARYTSSASSAMATPMRGRTMTRQGDESDSTSESDGQETAALAARWAQAKSKASAKNRIYEDEDSD